MAYLKRDMLSIETRNLIADYLADLALIVDSIESYRNSLAQLPDYDIISLFRFLDREEKGYLSVPNFQWLITSKSKKLLHYAFSWFDTSKVGEITRLEFIDFLLPRQNPLLKQKVQIALTAPKLPDYVSETLPYQTDLLKSLILQLINKEAKLIPIRRKIMNQQDYTIQAVMNSLDNDRNDYICVSDLYKFMKNYDIDVKHHHMKELLGSYDNDMNGKISLSELCNLIEGLENNKSEYRTIIRSSAKKQSSKTNRKRMKTEDVENKVPVPNDERKIKHKIKSATQKKKRRQNNISFAQQSAFEINAPQTNQFSAETNQKHVNNNFESLRHTFALMEERARLIDDELVQYGTQLEQSAKQQFSKYLYNMQIIKKEALIREQEEMERMMLLRQKEELEYQRNILIEEERREMAERHLAESIRREVELKWAREEQKLHQQARLVLQMNQREQETMRRSYVERKLNFSSSRPYNHSYHYERALNKVNKFMLEDDPLGIKEHLKETDQYLMRSRQIREQIKQQRKCQQKIQEYLLHKQTTPHRFQSPGKGGWQSKYTNTTNTKI